MADTRFEDILKRLEALEKAVGIGKKQDKREEAPQAPAKKGSQS